MRVLVTGGAGFMGKTVVSDLLAHGYEVRVLDKNVGPLAGLMNPKLELVTGGIEDAVKVKEAVAGCEVVYHLAETFSSNRQFIRFDIDWCSNTGTCTFCKHSDYIFPDTCFRRTCPVHIKQILLTYTFEAGINHVLSHA